MKKLQNNFTTPEQSKQLLELGVPADSADCYYSGTIKHIVAIDDEIDKKEFFRGNIIPCWSVGRLIEIFNICAHGYFAYIKTTDDKPLIKQVLSRYECECKIVGMDFSKLED